LTRELTPVEVDNLPSKVLMAIGRGQWNDRSSTRFSLLVGQMRRDNARIHTTLCYLHGLASLDSEDIDILRGLLTL
jgi:hypothetical protein